MTVGAVVTIEAVFVGGVTLGIVGATGIPAAPQIDRSDPVGRDLHSRPDLDGAIRHPGGGSPTTARSASLGIKIEILYPI